MDVEVIPRALSLSEHRRARLAPALPGLPRRAVRLAEVRHIALRGSYVRNSVSGVAVWEEPPLFSKGSKDRQSLVPVGAARAVEMGMRSARRDH